MALALTLLTIAVLLFYMFFPNKKAQTYIRPLPGLDEIENAIKSAAQLGRPVLYSTGVGMINEVATLSSLSMLSQVAELCVRHNCRLIVPIFDPVVYSAADEIVKSAFGRQGKMECYQSKDVYCLTNKQLSYASGIMGLMAREKPAVNFFQGSYGAEALILAESGAIAGAKQFTGTDVLNQVPFFIVSSDHTLIGEELYAAGGAFSRDPLALGILKGQDRMKLVVVILLIVLLLLKFTGIYQMGGL